jgi:pimeloyl-ACP methyl ester carboxylesterase
LLALDFADRVRSLVLISTSPALPGERELPASTEQYTRFVASAEADWSDSASVIEYLVGYSRVLTGGERPSMRPLSASWPDATSSALGTS